MGFDGLIIESHCNPDCAWSDKDQQVTPEALSAILDHLAYRDTPVQNESLLMLRQQIDQLDNELLDILSKRMSISREIGKYKKDHMMPVVQPGRYGDIVSTRVKPALTWVWERISFVLCFLPYMRSRYGNRLN